MQIANVLLSLGGDHGNQIMKHAVTAAEIAVLRAIHGDDAVQEVEPTGDVTRTHRAERERLLNTYGAAKSDDQKPIVESMFPGIAARVFEKLHELELPDSFFKATGRLKAPAAAAPVGEVAAEPEAPEAPTHDAEVDETVGDDIHDEHAEKPENILG